MKLVKIKSNNIIVSKFLFNLRKNNYIKKNSLNKKKIFFNQHQKWMESFFQKKNLLFIIFEKKIMIGYVRLEKYRNLFNVSWAINKKFQNKGYTKKSVQIATKNKNFRYKALIMKNNFQSKKIAKNANFKLKYKRNNIEYYYK
ncbi:GNAT family N-acetyltransferase [Candidatus Pelagibacter sp.]|uniref:GNAT family N-acetyltransferase n=1 Tax=Candidatus Pelagibacter sp. TaxID=2024849 RepID=UPI003F834A05